MSIVACPQCRKQVSLPAGASPQATVQCPLCNAEYELSSVLAQMPPALVVTGNGLARPVAFALPEAAEEPAFVGQSMAASAPASAPLAAAAPETFDLDEVGGPVHGEVTSLDNDNFDLEELPLEDEAASEQPLSFAPAGDDSAPAEAPAFAPGSAASIAVPNFEARKSRARRREPSAISNLIRIVVGGVVGCGIGYFVVLWIGGPDKDFLGLGPKLPRWSVPAAFNAGKQTTGVTPSPTADNNAGNSPSTNVAQANVRDVQDALGKSTVDAPSANGGDGATGATDIGSDTFTDPLAGADSAASLETIVDDAAASDLGTGLGSLAADDDMPATDRASDILKTGADLPGDTLGAEPDADHAKSGDDLGDSLPGADVPVADTPADDDLFGDKPATITGDDLPGDDMPADDAPVADTPADDDLFGDKPATIAGDDLPGDDMPADDMPADEPGLLDVPGDDGPATAGADDALLAPDSPADDSLPAADLPANDASPDEPAPPADAPFEDLPGADVPAPDGKTPDAGGAVRPAGAPEVSADELKTAVTNYRQSRAALAAAEQADDADAKKLRSQAFVKLYQLAAAASFADAGDRAAARVDVLRAAREIAAESDSPDHLGRAAAKWLQFAKRGANAGIVLSGTVVSTTQSGKLCEVVLQIAPDATASIVRSCDPHWPTGQRLLVVGSIVDDPKTNLAGYEGDSGQVVWMRICEALEK